MEHRHYSYIWTNRTNGKAYTGMGKGKRTYEHLYLAKVGKGKLLAAAIRKYGEDNFKLVFLEEGLTFEEAKLRERYYIKSRNTKSPNGYNLTDGGDGTAGFVMSDAQKEIIRLAQIERLKCPIYIENLKNKHTGLTHTEATKHLMSKSRTGKKFSEETKAKMSESIKLSRVSRRCTVEKHTEETKAKMSEAAKKRWANKRALSVSTEGS